MNENEKTELRESMATEVLSKLKATERAKNIAIVTMGIVIIVITVWLTGLNHKNDCEWRELFSTYDFVSQDGGGENYYNSNVGGNVNNGTKDKTQKGQQSDKNGDKTEE